MGARGTPRPALGPPFPCRRSPGQPVRFALAALESLAPGKGSQDRYAFTHLSFIHESIKFFLFFLYFFFFLKKKEKKKDKQIQ